MGSDPSVHTPGLTPYPSDPYLTPNWLSEPIIAEITVQFRVSFWSLQTPKSWVRWVQMGSGPSVHTPGAAPYPLKRLNAVNSRFGKFDPYVFVFATLFFGL